jgi:hypothetical protein
MRTRFPALAIISLLSFAAFTACDYEWKDEPPASEEDEVVIEEEDEEEPQEEEQKPPGPPPQIRPTLAPGKIVATSDTAPKDSKRISILDLEAAGKVKIDSPAAGQDGPKLFDGNEETLVRTESINPLVVTLTFTEPIKLKAVRVISTYSDYSWSLTTDGGERLIIDSVPDGVASVLVLPAPVTAKKISFEVLRKLRDNYVHVNEIELFE